MTIEYSQNDLASVFFKRSLQDKSNAELSFDSRSRAFSNNGDLSTVTLEIGYLSNSLPDDWWDKKQPNAQKIFQGSNATLVICFGRPDWIGEHSTRQDLSITNKEVFIFWQVDNLEYLIGLSQSLSHSSELSIKIDLECSDSSFETLGKDERFEIPIRSISLNLS